MLKSIASSFLPTAKRNKSSCFDTTDAHVQERHTMRAAELLLGVVFGVILPWFVFSSSALAATYFVSKSGNNSTPCGQGPKLTINAGIACMAGGDTLIIGGGTYNEIIASFNTAVTVAVPSGTAGAPTIIRAAAGERVLLQPMFFGYPGGGGVVSLGGSYVTVDGINVNAGFQTQTTDNRSGNGYSVDGDHMVVQNAELMNGNGEGIITSGSFHIMRNLHIHDFRFNRDGSPCVGHRNDDGQPCPHGLYITGTDHLIEQVSSHDNSGNGIQLTCEGCTSTRNTIRNSSFYNNHNNWGIVAHPGNHIYNNLVYNNLDGIHANGGTDVYNNSVYNNGEIGIWPDGSGVRVKNNIVIGHKWNILDQNTTNLDFAANICDSLSAPFTIGCTKAASAANVFLNPAGADFHLQAGSPAIDAGMNLSSLGITTDIDGRSRPQGVVYDIGAYEFGGSSVLVPPAPTVTLTASSLTITSGQSSTLNWSSTNVTNCSTSGGWSGVQQLFGSFVVFPTATTLYSLTCTGSGGSGSASVTISVNASSVPVVPVNNNLTAFKTDVPIVIDGNLSEAIWSQANSVSFSNSAQSDNQVKVFGLWDNQNLYLAYQVTDSKLEAADLQYYQDDGAEIYLDTLNNKSTAMDANDFSFAMNIHNLVSPAGPIVKTVTSLTGYTMEIALPWSTMNTLPAANKVLGLLLGNNDRDNGISKQFDWMNLITTGSYFRPNLWGNLTLSGTVVSSTIVPPALTPLVHLRFDDASGITAKDSATADGVQNGTLINAPIWTIGKVGGAIFLNGINQYIGVPDSASVDLTSPFTLAAWVKPAVVITNFRSIIVKNYTYFLYAGSNTYCATGAPIGGISDGVSTTVACTPTPLAANIWAHLVLTFDGTTLRLYKDGMQVATALSSVSPVNTTGILQIGASQFGEYLNGTIDDVRLYNRALSASEIQSIMVPPDTTPPTVSMTAPILGAVVSGTVPVSANSSDNIAVVGVQFFLSGTGMVNQPLGPEDTTAPSPFTLTGGWNTTTVPNGSYTITALTRDAAGNKATSLPLTVTVRNPLPILSTHLSVFSVDSEELVGENGAATNAIDANPATKWVTEWTDSLGNPLGIASPPHPHTIVLKLDSTYSVSGLSYLPRQDVPEVNGNVKGYTLYLSTDGVNWGLAVATGTFLNSAEEKRVNFTARNALYIKFVAVSEVNANPWTAAAEIKLFGTLPIDTTPPTVPLNLKATPVSSAAVTLSWSASTDAVGVVGYDVYRNGLKIARTTTTTYADTMLTPLTTYTYTVSAYDAAGNLSARSFSVSAKTLKFKVGDTIKVGNGPLNVRSCAGTLCAVLGKQFTLEQLGTIIAGPTIANAFTWWNIDYATGADGWSVENYLVGSATVLPALGARIPERTTQIASIASQLESVNETINSYTTNPAHMNASVLTSLADTLAEMQRRISALTGE